MQASVHTTPDHSIADVSAALPPDRLVPLGGGRTQWQTSDK